MKKVIVSGAGGFLGRALVKELLSNGIEVIALAKDENEKIPEGARVVLYDMADSDKLLERIKDRDIDVFYHLAWGGVSVQGRTDPQLQMNNALWTVNTLKTAHSLGAKKFICAGSIMEHETFAALFMQGNKPGMGYIYGAGKYSAHTMCNCVGASLGIDVVWPLITNVYGPGEMSTRFINTTLKKIINNEKLEFTAGTQNYDFIYVDDFARVFRLLGEKGKPFCNYIIGSGNARPLREFVLDMKDAVAKDKEFVFGDIPYTGAQLPLKLFDMKNTFEDLGYKPQVSFKEGIKRTKAWLETVVEKNLSK